MGEAETVHDRCRKILAKLETGPWCGRSVADIFMPMTDPFIVSFPMKNGDFL
jgi:hypothetical protein